MQREDMETSDSPRGPLSCNTLNYEPSLTPSMPTNASNWFPALAGFPSYIRALQKCHPTVF